VQKNKTLTNKKQQSNINRKTNTSTTSTNTKVSNITRAKAFYNANKTRIETLKVKNPAKYQVFAKAFKKKYNL